MNFSNQIVSAGLNEERPIAGVSDVEIAALEQASMVKLPECYKQFLRQCGKYAGLYQRDANFFYPAIKSLKEELSGMILEDGLDFLMPENIFVFSSYQGYQYSYFLCDGSSDPAVYRITNNNEGEKEIAKSFSSYVEISIQQYRKAFYKTNE